MALRDQPYFPLYVQDYLTDEKLNCCSAASQGVYIKIMCVLHKQENYGQILFKQKDKQKSSMIENFAYKFAKQLPFDYETILPALTELVEEGVLQIEGDILSQKRMVKDFKTSQLRSEAAKKGGGNPNLFKQKPKPPFKQKPKQNTEYEYEYESVNGNKKGVQGEKTKQPRILDFSGLGPEFKEKWDEWITYKKSQHSDRYKSAETEQKAINRLIQISGSDKNLASKIIDSSIANLWKGLIEPKPHQINGTSNNSTTTNAAPKSERVGRMAKGDLKEYLDRPIPIISIGGSGN